MLWEFGIVVVVEFMRVDDVNKELVEDVDAVVELEDVDFEAVFVVVSVVVVDVVVVVVVNLCSTSKHYCAN